MTLSGVLLAAPASAQEFDVENFQPVSPGDDELLGVQSASQVEYGGYAVGLAFAMIENPLVVVDQDDEERVAEVVGSRFTTQLAAAYGLGRIELLASLPVILYQDSSPNSVVGVSSIGGGGIGDLRLGSRARILGDGVAGFGLSGSLVAAVPTATAEFAGQGSPQVVPKLAAEWRASGALVAANVGARLRGTEQIGDLEVGSALLYGLGASLQPEMFGPIAALAEIEGEMAGSSARAAPLEIRGGIRADLGSSMSLTAAYGRGLVYGYGAPDHRALLMMSWGREPAETARPQGPIATATPPPNPDPDGDGILGEDDSCPNTSEDFDGFEDEDGCPEEDNDTDGILDADDKCPNHGEDVDEYQDEDGCPDPDNDMDGIVDLDDSCPVEAEIINGVEDDDGCPDEGKALVEVGDTQIEIKEVIHFALDRAEILPRSEPLLEQLATTIKRSAWIKRIRIEGHTDASGSDEYNQELSQQRAEAVLQALEERGVEGSRLEAVGHGESQPIDSNDTLRGRAHNRRVEFHIVEQDEEKRPDNIGKDGGVFDRAQDGADEAAPAGSTGTSGDDQKPADQQEGNES